METARKTVLLLLWLMLFPAVSQAMQEAPVTLPGRDIVWAEPETGMELALLSYTVQKSDGYSRRILTHALRMDPQYFDFRLFSARWENGPARPMREWAEEKGLAAAVNAGMYQTDGLSSTGYMRQGRRVSNGRIVKRYGAFFVSGPRREGLPRAAVLDRNEDDWQALLPEYESVVQNFRLMGPQGRQLWPEDGPRHAVAAVAQDDAGRILFLICTEPVSVHDFVDALNAHPALDLRSAMYVEGGSDATVLMESGGETHLLSGLSPAGHLLSSRGTDIPLPNILGAMRRERKAEGTLEGSPLAAPAASPASAPVE